MQKVAPPVSYRLTTYACYIGNLVQAIVVNFTPVLFLTLRGQFGLSFQQLGLLITINFIAQVTIDLTFARLIDKHGFRIFAVGGHIAAAVGFLLFAMTPLLPVGAVYGWLILATIVFSIGGGLMEILLSPIVNAIPTDEKAAAMSLLHSFYAWGQVTVVLVTTVLLFLLPHGFWPIIALLWTAIPVANAFLFSRVPLAPPIPEEQRTGMRRILKDPFFFVAMAVIMTGAMAELCMSQWASAFLEVMGMSKVTGDLLGMCMFGVMLGIGRAWYGKVGSRVKLHRVMLLGSALAAVCYVTVAFSGAGVLSLIACALAGLGASLLWPGSLVLAAERFPYAGAVLFAVMAAGGDVGASIGPWLVGIVAEYAPASQGFAPLVAALGAEQFGLRAGMLLGAVFPLLAFVGTLYLRRAGKRAASIEDAA